MTISAESARKLAEELLASRRLNTGLILCVDVAAADRVRQQAMLVLEQIKRSEIVWCAPSHWHALCWLAIVGHASSCATPFAQSVMKELGLHDSRFVFRGQSCRYPWISPSLWRLDVNARRAHLASAHLLREAIQRGLDSVEDRARKEATYDDTIHRYWLDDDDAFAFAQHYEVIKTHFVDWTLAPEIAFYFACLGSGGKVAVYLKHAPSVQGFVGLRPPPALCRRLWCQFGLLERHDGYEGLSLQNLQEYMLPANRCWRIVFETNSSFEGIPKPDIMPEDDDLTRLSAWCLSVAECWLAQPTEIQNALLSSILRHTAIPSILEELRKTGCTVGDLPEPDTWDNGTIWAAAATLIMRFFDVLCMEYREGKFVHDAMWAKNLSEGSDHLENVLLGLRKQSGHNLAITEKLASAASLFQRNPKLKHFELVNFGESESEIRYSKLEQLSAEILAPGATVPL